MNSTQQTIEQEIAARAGFWVLQHAFVYLMNQKPVDSYAMQAILEVQKRFLRA